MKIKSTLAMIFVALFMASCDKEGNDPKVLDFSGSYEGYTLASSSYFQNMVSAGEIISIAENPDGTASVSFTSATWGEFTIADAQANMSGSLCTLAGSGQARMGMGGNTSSYECSFTAEIKSQSEARMTFEIPAVMGGMKIEFTTGNAPADLLLAGTYAGYTDADCLYFQDRYTDGGEHDADGKRRRNRQGRIRVRLMGNLLRRIGRCGHGWQLLRLYGQRKRGHGDGRIDKQLRLHAERPDQCRQRRLFDRIQRTGRHGRSDRHAAAGIGPCSKRINEREPCIEKEIGRIMLGAAAFLSFPSCNGIFEGIYDKPSSENEYGFIAVDEGTRTGRIYIDATDYTEWHYIDLQGKRVTTVTVGGAAPETWDFAVHRYDTKTNGGAVWGECGQ